MWQEISANIATLYTWNNTGLDCAAYFNRKGIEHLGKCISGENVRAREWAWEYGQVQWGLFEEEKRKTWRFMQATILSTDRGAGKRW